MYSSICSTSSVSQDYAITKSDFENYDNFCFLTQIKAKEAFGNNTLDMEVEIPSNAKVICSGENVEFYKLLNNKDFKILPHEPPTAIGIVSNMSDGRFTISNGKLNYVVDYDGHLGDLKNGKKVEVWGALRPFNTIIKAEKIINYQANRLPTLLVNPLAIPTGRAQTKVCQRTNKCQHVSSCDLCMA